MNTLDPPPQPGDFNHQAAYEHYRDRWQADFNHQAAYEHYRDRWQARVLAQVDVPARVVRRTTITSAELDAALGVLGLMPAPGQHLMSLTICEGSVRADYAAIRRVVGGDSDDTPLTYEAE